jgi:hypothetical protein
MREVEVPILLVAIDYFPKAALRTGKFYHLRFMGCVFVNFLVKAPP